MGNEVLPHANQHPFRQSFRQALLTKEWAQGFPTPQTHLQREGEALARRAA
jgi:hypothetical protein